MENQTVYIRNRRPSLVHLPAAADCPPITLRPGINRVPVLQLNALGDHPTVSFWFDKKKGFLSIEEFGDGKNPADVAPPETLGELRVTEAAAVIAKTDDMALLMHWADNDTREPIKTACENRLDELQATNK